MSLGERLRKATFNGRTAAWIAGCACLAIALLTFSDYRAIREWQRSSTELARQRADQGADLLVAALTRDMRAVQKSVLSLPDWDSFMLDSPYDVGTIAASAFARYPYPETFFAGRGDLSAIPLVFFSRSSRPPQWSTYRPGSTSFPVAVETRSPLDPGIVARVLSDATDGKAYSIFDTEYQGVPYQVVGRLLYRDQYREAFEGVFGFLVNMSWVRDHYFSELRDQVSRIGNLGPALSLEVLDDRGERLTTPPSRTPFSLIRQRAFPVMFFDPLIIASDPPSDLARLRWTAQVGVNDDPGLVAAFRGANRTLIVATLAATALVLAFVLAAHAVSETARLAETRSAFVATVTHELKAPIGTIKAAGDTLLSGRVSTAEGQREYVAITVQEAKRLNRLVDNLLAFSRITDVTAAYLFEPLAVDALLAAVLSDLQQQLAVAETTKQVDIPQGLSPVRADQRAIELALCNVVDNAVRYSPPGCRLTITAGECDEMVEIAIADNGPGIPPDELPHVTRRFYRGRQAASGGSGLGLAIVRRIIEDHRGRLEITSALGTGTVVRLHLPMAREEGAAS